MTNTTLATVDNFTAAAPRNGIATARTDGDRAIAEVQASMAIAKRFPRDVIAAKDRIINACTRPRLAEGALYSYSRGGSDVSGPSIRLAECMAQQWGNLAFGVRELEQRDGESTVEAYCWDMETNTRAVKVFQVPHQRDTKRGPQPLKDARDIYEHVANMGARRLRSCILGIIPGDVVEEAVLKCEETLQTKCDTGPEAVKKMLGVFRDLGVTREQIEARIQCRAESIRPAQMVQMRKIYSSIHDGMSVAADWFEAIEVSTSSSTAGDVNADSLTSGKGAAQKRPHQQKSDDGPTPEGVAGTVGHDETETTAGGETIGCAMTRIQALLDAADTPARVDEIVHSEIASGEYTGPQAERIEAAGATRKRIIAGAKVK